MPMQLQLIKSISLQGSGQVIMNLESSKKESRMQTLSSKCLSSSEILLPLDVIIEILLWLPAKVVSRFKYVCKDWFSLISEPEFIKKHLQRHSTDHGKNNPSSLFIISRFVDLSFLKLKFFQWLKLSVLKHQNISIHSVDYNFIDDDDASRVVKIQNIPPPIKSAGSGFKCLGSCNGLLAGICSETKERDVLCLWNPCTEEYREIIQPKQSDKLYDTTATMWKMQDRAYGFGYDPIMCDYKLLANTCYHSVTDDHRAPGDVVFHWKIVAKVYTLGTNSWRNMGEYPYQLSKYPEASGGLLVGGALYWRAINSASSLDIIICFDLSDEVYREIPIPRCISHRNGGGGPMSFNVKLDLREFKGCLSIFRVQYFSEDTVEVWVMMTTKVDSINVKEEGVVSWSKLFTISDYQLVLAYRYKESMWLEPGICKDDGFLMVREWKDLYWYNPTDDKKTRRILADTHGEFSDMFTSVLTYTESLASLNPHNTCLTGHKEENEQQQQQQGIRVQNGKSKTRRFLARLLPRCYCYGC